MTKLKKQNNHVESLIKNLNMIYEEYKKEKDVYRKAEYCRVLRSCAYGVSQDFNELEWILEMEE